MERGGERKRHKHHHSDGPKKRKRSRSTSDESRHASKKHNKTAKKKKHSDRHARRKEEKKLKKKMKREKSCNAPGELVSSEEQDFIGPMPTAGTSKALAPMTKDEWDKRRNVIKKVYDPESGRERLIKGDGEVMEQIVSRQRHAEINKRATRGDGQFFQQQLASLRK